METELSCIHDSRNTFYGKARVINNDDGRIILISYSTEVAYIEKGKAFVLGKWSSTTSRHIKEFLLQNGFIADNTKQILKDYLKN